MEITAREATDAVGLTCPNCTTPVLLVPGAGCKIHDYRHRVVFDSGPR